MCGISGWQLPRGVRLDREVLTAMADALDHRGPDDRGYFLTEDGTTAFAQNRLSIIDLSPAGHQPMISDDGAYVLNYNGELYNFRSLRAELESDGHVFKSRCDTEVVLRAWEAWGRKALRRFDGMFALAVWEARSGTMVLARDPLGMKPLYYARIPGDCGLAFASEVKAFERLPGFRNRMNRRALRQFLEFGYTFDEHETSLEDVFKVPPGHYVEVREGETKPPRLFFESPCPRESPEEEAIESLHLALSEVVREHLYADVPVALLLSGGLDSSLVAALAARESRSITTISMGFAESRVDERANARLVSDFIGSDHHEIVIRASEIPDELEEGVWWFDDLFGDWGTLTTRILYRRCRDMGIKVVLVGEGADELFGGYPIFRHPLMGPRFTKIFQLYRQYAGRRYGREFGAFWRVMRRYLKDADGDFFHAIRLFESKNQLPNNYVMKVDKASMSVSVEARAPYLDRRIARIAYRTPEGRLLGDGTNKWLLRRVAEQYNLLPSETTWRRKFGGSIAASWMDDSPTFRSFARERILHPDGWVDRLGLRKAMVDYFAGRRSGAAFPYPISIFRNLAWRMLLLNLWSQRYQVL